MDTTVLKKFAQAARRQLLEQVAGRLEQVLRSDSVEIREKAKVVAELKAQIEVSSKRSVIDRVAYTWFNRFCALRFMDVNHYTRIGVVSPVEEFTQPEVLQEAKQGHIDEDLLSLVEKQTIFDLLNEKRPSSDPQQEAYRLLLVGICNSFNKIMPFMFEKIEDYTELLMPLDLLSENSVLHDLREALTPEACRDVEVIGWLYQYYISERKDDVFEALKRNEKIEAQDIPAATQLFTPHWIVRYLVENSLGRLWMLNHPESRLTEKMEYYIKPEQVETDFLKIASPEELKICDPACGSGHILTYAFDLLFAIYEEQGYPTAEIPRMILEKNLFGIEIDPRAGALSAFAIYMKGRSKDKRFFSRGVGPNVCVLENVTFTDSELKQYMNAVGRDLFTEPLKETLSQFEQADNFGSLICPTLTDTSYLRGMLEGKNLSGDLFLYSVNERVLKVLKQAEYLAPRYHIVVANPPYMGDIGMNNYLKEFAKSNYSTSSDDLFAMFIERNMGLTVLSGFVGMITMQGWMFQSSYEEFRSKIIANNTIVTLAHLGPKAFDSIGGEVVSTTAFIVLNSFNPGYRGIYIRLVEEGNEAQKQAILLKLTKSNNYKITKRFIVSSNDLKAIPGCPIAYWISDKVKACFKSYPPIGNYIALKAGLSTGDNNIFQKNWFEIKLEDISFLTASLSETEKNKQSWYPCHSGGTFRKWYGNHSTVVYWRNNGEQIRKFGAETGRIRSAVRNDAFYFKPGITWTKIGGGSLSVRFRPSGYIFDDTGRCGFADENVITYSLGFLCSKVANEFLRILSPSLGFTSGSIAKIPFAYSQNADIMNNIERCITTTKLDWDSWEWSWDFFELPLLKSKYREHLLAGTYQSLRQDWGVAVKNVQQAEEENNRIFIETYGLEDELTSDVPLEEITLTCNPYYRYGGTKSDGELEELLLVDTMKEFISYSVGCMFGRYSLDMPGLILANQGESVKDYLKQISKPTYMPDEDNVIPVLEGEWFNDDVSERFKKFLRVTFGDKHYEENLTFIEESIGRDIRSYFIKEFYKEHVQMYKKRPIYWMFSSPKGSFNVLIYMHRYKPDTVSIVLDGYLREYVKKLTSHRSHLEAISVSANSSQSQKTKALREITQIDKVLAELKEYERDIFELASQQIKIDLDDGVKVNYNKFGSALSYIPGLSQ